MRALLLACVLGVTVAGSASAQLNNDNEAWPIPLMVTPGSMAQVSYTQEKNKNGEIAIANATAELSVQNELDTGFVATWKMKSLAVGDLLIDESTPQAASFYIGIPFQFEAAIDGEPVRIYDKEQLLNGLTESPIFEDYDDATLKNAVELFNSMTDEALAATFVKVPYYLSICQATSLPIAHKVETQGEVASPFGNGSLLGFTSYELTSVDDRQGIAQIEYHSGFDPESMKAMVVEMFQNLAPDKTPTEEEITQTSIIQSTSAECVVDLKAGWVTEMLLENVVEAGGEFQSEKYSISVSWVE